MEQKSTSTIELAIQDKYMLTVKEAAAYFNMGIKKIRRLAEDNEGGFALKIGSRYMICRPRFEEYLVGLMEKRTAIKEGLIED